MNKLGYFAIAVCCAVTMTACWLYYEAVSGWSGALRANRMLSEELVTGDAALEALVDDTNGDLFVRVNGKHIHHFAQACSSVKSRSL